MFCPKFGYNELWFCATRFSKGNSNSIFSYPLLKGCDPLSADLLKVDLLHDWLQLDGLGLGLGLTQ